MPSLNLGILAHVDAGKTSLTERLLFEAGVIGSVGSVDAGTTRTDSMDLERRRGITIRATVASLRVGDLDVNIIDTPGHPDFIAEVERSLNVLDAAILVLSSVEGVQSQTVVLWRALRRVGIATAMFVNKVDRRGSDVNRVVAQIRSRLTPAAVVLASAKDQGTSAAEVVALPLEDEAIIEAVADRDDSLMRRWVEGGCVTSLEVEQSLRRAVPEGALFPVLYGSAVTNAGVSQLQQVISTLFSVPQAQGSQPSAEVFAVDHDERGRRTWLRLWDGRLHVRDNVSPPGRREERITEIAVSTPQGLSITAWAQSGDIAAVRGLTSARIGDVIGAPPPQRSPQFPPATMEVSVEADDPAQRGALFAALAELSDEDPLIDPRLDEFDGNARVRIHGEVQKEVIGALLEERFGVRAHFNGTFVVCIERVIGAAEAIEEMGKEDNPYLATIGLRVEPADVGHGLTFSPGTQRGNLPPSFIAACEEGVRSALEQGLYGWAVTDCHVTMTASAYCPRQSHAHQSFNKAMSSVGADFRNLAPVVTLACLEKGGTRVCEPIESFEIEAPEWSVRALISLLRRLAATPQHMAESGGYTYLNGHIPSAQVAGLSRSLLDVTGGEGVLTTRLDHYAPVQVAAPPTRGRSGVDPRDRALWFRAMTR
jgi:ribosomal protection tetracycline resistance protein